MKAPAASAFGDQDFVAQYDRGPPLFIPGYHASHDMAAALLTPALPENAHLLIIGAGGGAEIAAFAGHAPAWRYTAVDPARQMLDLARARLERDGVSAKVEWCENVSTGAPDGPFDAATAFLALVFAPDDGERLAQMQAIHRRLRPGAPFLLINAATDDFERDLATYLHHARLRGAEEEMMAKAAEMNRRDVHYLSPAREEELLHQAGFKAIRRFYQGLWVHGWMAAA